jgi:hypothetical protein
MQELSCSPVGNFNRDQLPPRNRNFIRLASTDQLKANVSLLTRPHIVRNEPSIALARAKPNKCRIPINVDPERRIATVVEDKCTIGPATHRPETVQKRVVIVDLTRPFEICHIHQAVALLSLTPKLSCKLERRAGIARSIPAAKSKLQTARLAGASTAAIR